MFWNILIRNQQKTVIFGQKVNISEKNTQNRTKMAVFFMFQTLKICRTQACVLFMHFRAFSSDTDKKKKRSLGHKVTILEKVVSDLIRNDLIFFIKQCETGQYQ